MVEITLIFNNFLMRRPKVLQRGFGAEFRIGFGKLFP
jgi:hypothetical protein